MGQWVCQTYEAIAVIGFVLSLTRCPKFALACTPNDEMLMRIINAAFLGLQDYGIQTTNEQP